MLIIFTAKLVLFVGLTAYSANPIIIYKWLANKLLTTTNTKLKGGFPLFQKKRLPRLLITLVLGLSFVLGFGLVTYGASTYTVAVGDTLWKISQRYHVALSDLIKSNPQLPNPNYIEAGQTIKIPATTTATTTSYKPTTTTTIPTTTTTNTGISAFNQQVLDLTNAERAKAGLSPLKYNAALSNVATLKSQDMRDKNYFSHTSPTYGSPFAMMEKFSIKYTYAGENIAAGYSTPQAVVTGWMNSAGHRQNILNSNYNQIGIGYAAGGSYGHYWTQMFIRS